MMFPNTRKLLLFCCLAGLAAGHTPASAAPQKTRNSPVAPRRVSNLTPGKTSEYVLTGAGRHRYRVRLSAHQLLHVIVDQRGIDVVVTLFGPASEKLIEVDNPNGSFGFEALSWTAEIAGQYTVVIRSLERDVSPGRYQLTADVRASRPQDLRAGEARKLFAQGEQLRQRENPGLEKAIEKYSAALPLWREAGESSMEATTLHAIGSLYEDLNLWRKALEFFEQALVPYRTIGDRSGEAATLSVMGQAYDSLDEYQHALKYYEQALTIQRVVGNRLSEAVTLNNIGSIYSSLGERRRALEFYYQALPIRRAVRDKNGEASTLVNIGDAYADLGENLRALAFFNQALPIMRAVENKHGEAVTLGHIGSVYSDLGNRQKALEFYNQALTIVRAEKDKSTEATTLNKIGLVNSDLGERQKALEILNESLLIRRTVGDKHGEAVTLLNIGAVYSLLGDQPKALEFHQQALTLMRAVGDKRGEGGALINIGHDYAQLDDDAKTLEYYNRALAIMRAVGDKNSEATLLNNIGGLYSERDEQRKALEFYNQALPIMRAVGDKSLEATILANLGFAYFHLGEKGKALALYHQALPIRRAVGDREGEANTLHNLMSLWRDDGKPALAIFYGKAEVNRLQELRSNIKGLDQGLQKSYLSSIEKSYRQLADLLISVGRLPEAQQVLGMLKDQEYFEFVRRDSGTSPVTERATLTSEEARSEETFRKLSDDLARLGRERGELFSKVNRTPQEDRRLATLDEQLAVAVDHFNKFLEQLQVQFGPTTARAGRVVEVQDALGMKKTLRELGPNVALLYTLVGEDKYWVMLVTPDAEQAYENPIKMKDLQRKVFDFREALEDPRADAAPLARQLYDILIGPKLSHDLKQGGARTLMWSLDGVLRYLPVAALQDESGKYLVENYANVIFTPASRDRLKDPVQPHWKGLGLGVSKARAGFRELPGVPQELRAIIRDQSSAAGGTEGLLEGKVMLDESFTKDAMKAALRQNYQLVHIASHFRFQPGDETASFLLVGDADDRNSRLTLSEIRKLSFEGINLLTLSACETAMSDTKANGIEVESFGVLAQRQGAEAVMATLWRVADVSTPKLMREFYEQREGGLSKAEALRRAQLSLLESKTRFSHPYFWAPFILIGNWK